MAEKYDVHLRYSRMRMLTVLVASEVRDPEYRRTLKDWESFVEALTERVIEADETIPELPLKDIIFRIYRDIRFSKDPTPYKVRFVAFPQCLWSKDTDVYLIIAPLFSSLVSYTFTWWVGITF
jgi:uncharacterized protein (DUF2461 family)